MNSLAQTIQALEVELHHPGVRCSRERLDQLLHPQFHEVGRSGRTYSRDTVIEFLLSQASAPAVRSEHFQMAELAPGVALLTYRSAQAQPDGQLVNHTLRASVWMGSGDTWQLRYHQGTPAAQAQYRALQQLGEFDTKTSSWIATPEEVRRLGGALFCDRRYGRVFVYHNGAQSYHAVRGFRGLLRV